MAESLEPLTRQKLWRSLRFRLSLWNALVVLSTAIVTLGGLRQGVRWALIHEMDQILIEDLREIELALEDTPRDSFAGLVADLQRKSVGHRQHGWFVQLVDAAGALRWGSSDAPPNLVSQVQGDMKPASVDGYRIVSRALPRRSHSVAAIFVGAKLELLQEDLAKIDQMVVIACGFVMLGAPLCGYWMARRAARALSDIVRTASHLRPANMDERLPTQGTGDELDELANTINGLLDRISIYLNEKRDFLANAAHELRTPLAAIRSSVEVALTSDRSRAEYEELLADVIDQTAALETLVNQLLLLAETEADRLDVQVESVSLADVVKTSVDMFQGVAESRGISLHAPRAKPLEVRGSRHHLLQVVNNLIDNAIKYTPAGGSVYIDLHQSDNLAQLVVRDTGIGIAEEDLPHVFERFYRADKSRTRIKEISGTGLGLSICQAIVAAYGGTIDCDSGTEGTTFTVSLPLAAASMLAPKS